MKFSEIPGNESIKEKLVGTAKSGKYSHAQLFAGSEGSANLQLAIAYGQFLNCESPEDNDSCGTCPNCIKISKLIHPDFVSIMPVAKVKPDQKEVISATFANEWRSFVEENIYGGITEWAHHFGAENKQLSIPVAESRNLIKTVAMKSFEARVKIFLIWLPEYMHPAAANAILKVIEEPPPSTVFLLVTNNATSILGTIQSRCVRVNILPFTMAQVTEVLEKDGINKETASIVASIAEGNMNRAHTLVHEVGEGGMFSFEDWMRVCYSRGYEELVHLSEEFHSLTKEQQKSLLKRGITLLRESLVFEVAEVHKHAQRDNAFITNFSKAMTPEKVEQISIQLNTAYSNLERNASPKIVFLDTSLQITSLLKK